MCLRPGHRDQPVQVGADDAIFGRGGGQAREAVQLAAGLLFGLLGHVGFFDALAELLDVGGLLVAFTQLALDGFELLAQEVLVLHLFDLGAGFVLDLLTQLQHFRFACQDADQPAQFFADRIDFQQRLGFGQVHALEVGDGVDDLQRVVDGARWR